MSKRIIQVLIIIIILVILGLAAYFAFRFVQLKPIAKNVNSQATNLNASLNQNLNQVVAPAQPMALPRDDNGKIKLLAAVFVPTYGSFSNQSGLTNFDNLYPYMTASLKNWVSKTYKMQILKDHPLDSYYAITAKILKTTVSKLDASQGTAQILVSTQRQEFSGSPTNPKVYNQDVQLNAVKSGNDWLINSVYWQ